MTHPLRGLIAGSGIEDVTEFLIEDVTDDVALMLSVAGAIFVADTGSLDTVAGSLGIGAGSLACAIAADGAGEDVEGAWSIAATSVTAGGTVRVGEAATESLAEPLSDIGDAKGA